MRDPVAHRDERGEQAIAVADRGDAGLQVPLREFERQFLAALRIFDRRVASLRVAVDGAMDVAVDESGQQIFPSPIDDARAGWHVAALSDRLDAAVPDKDRHVRAGRRPGAVDQGHAHDRERFGLGARRADAEQEKRGQAA